MNSLRFVQIATSAAIGTDDKMDWLYGLDDDGQVWIYEESGGKYYWKPLSMETQEEAGV